MLDFFKNKRGYTLVEVIVAVTLITTLVASYVNLFNGMLTSTTYFRDNMTAQMLAANKWKELDLVTYASLATEAKAAVGTTEFQREVILGADVDLGTGNHKRDVTINVYKTGNATPLYTAPKTMTSAGSGTVISHGIQTFTSNGSFTIPDGITKVWVSMAGGGGGGGGSSNNGSAGGTTSFGTYISCSGGGGGAKLNINYAAGGSAGNPNGQTGSPGSSGKGGDGGDSLFGAGGKGIIASSGSPSYGAAAIGNGSGGAGGSSYWNGSSYGESDAYYAYGGGGSGGSVLKNAVTVTPGQVVNITVGTGGTGGTSGGGNGTSGICIIEW